MNRYFKSVFNNDIIKDKEFEEAKSVLEAHCVYLKKRGLAKTEHKPPIADEDIKKLYESGVSIQKVPLLCKTKSSLKLCSSSVVEEGRISVN